MNRFVFFGGKAIGNFILDKLIEENRIPQGVIVYRDTLDKQLLEKCENLGIKLLRLQTFKNNIQTVVDFVNEIQPNYYISVAFPFILPKEILTLVKFPVNIHTGAIPKYRGHHPISAALLNDEPYQATTIHIMAEQVDAGPILLQDFVRVTNEDTILTIREKLIRLSKELLFTVIDQMKAGLIYPKEQIGEIIWAPKRNPEDSQLTFNKPSRHLHNFIRSLVDPYPNAFCSVNGKVVKIKQSVACNTAGVVLHEVKPYEYVVSSNDGIVWIKTDVELKVGDHLV